MQAVEEVEEGNFQTWLQHEKGATELFAVKTIIMYNLLGTMKSLFPVGAVMLPN